MKYELIKDLDDVRFKANTGVKKDTFLAMVLVLETAYAEAHKKYGRPRKLSIENMLLATLEYLHEYRSYECIAGSYGLTRPNMYKTIKWVEDTLIQSGLFNLPGKKVLSAPGCEIEVILVDTTETPIERPKKGQRHYYSGKKNDIR